MAVLSAFDKAFDLAVVKHAEQVDKRGRPYMGHVLAVLRETRASAPAGLDIELLGVAALLHDIVEDTDVTLTQIRKGFGPEVAEIVDHLTRRSGETYTGYVTRAASHPAARIVKLADNTVNSIDPPTGSLAKRYAKARSVLLAAGPLD